MTKINKDGIVFTVSKSTNLRDVEKKCPAFFQVTFGKKETIVDYKGFIIVGYTMPVSNVRKYVVYLYDVIAQDTFAWENNITSLNEARSCIDTFWRKNS